MGGSSHLDERRHVQHARFPSSQIDSRASVAVTHENGLGVSLENPDNYPASAAQAPMHTRAASGQVNSPSKHLSRAINPSSSIDVASSSQERPGLSNHSTAQDRSSPYQSQLQFEPKQSIKSEATSPRVASNPLSMGVHSNGLPRTSRPPSPPKMVVGQKRTAAGVIKSPAGTSRDSHNLDPSGTERRRSKSIGSVSHGSRIAALSVHLRTRLSYAAAKVEKSRQSHGGHNQLPLELLQSDALTSETSTDALGRIRPYSCPGEADFNQGTDGNSPDGTTVSAPDPSATSSHFYPLESHMRTSPVARSDSLSPTAPQQINRPRSQASLPTPHAAPKLAPPADIIPSSSNARRRRPNPNEAFDPPRYALFPRHRRHHSQQEIGASRSTTSSDTILVPGTPPLRPSAQTTSTPYNGITSQPGHSQNTAMEQDAIETLLFMSSPGNLGYISNSQPSQGQPSLMHSSISNSIDSVSSSRRGQDSRVDGEASRSSSKSHGSGHGLEAQAGDEIDRMLDQMDSDSEDEHDRGPSRLNGRSVQRSSSGLKSESKSS